MTDEHMEPRATFPTGMLMGSLVLALVIAAILGWFAFVKDHGAPGAAPPSPAAQQQK